MLRRQAGWVGGAAKRLMSTGLEKTFTNERTLPFPPAQLFNVVADVGKYQEFVPYCVKSDVVSRERDNSFHADLQIGFNMFHERYRSRVTLVPDEYVGAECVQSRIFERLLSEWRFSQTPSLSTTVQFTVHFRVASSLHARVMEMFFDDVADKHIAAFEQRCREIGTQSTGSSFTRQDKHVQQRLRQAFHAACDLPGGVVDVKGLGHACSIVSDLGDCLYMASQNPLSLAAMHAAFDSNSDGQVGEDEFLHGAGALLELETAHLCGGRGARSEHAFRILEDACRMELGEAKVAAIFRRKMERIEQLVPQALAMRTSSQLPRLQSGGKTDEELISSVRAAKNQAERIIAKVLPPEALSSREQFRAAVDASPGLQEALWPEGWAGLSAVSLLLEEGAVESSLSAPTLISRNNHAVQVPVARAIA